MKIRAGFVSNSSTSSFCIYGICLEDYDLIQKACDLKKIKCDVESDDFEPYEACEELIEGTGLEYRSGPEGEGSYFGISLSNMKDDETYGNFKKRISEKLAEIFGEKMDCDVMEEAWRDG